MNFLRRISSRPRHEQNRSLSLPALANAQQTTHQTLAELQKRPSLSVPAKLKAMDYNRAMDYFKLYDSNGNGMLDKAQFYRFINSVEPISRDHCEKMFDAVDVDKNGTIEVEEFLSWCFQTHSIYCGDVRDRLASMDPQKVIAYLNSIDANGNGQIDRQEFYTFIKTFSPESHMSRQDTDKLFASIDVDRSGEIDAREFITWVYRNPSKQGATSSAPKLRRRGSAMEPMGSSPGLNVPDEISPRAAKGDRRGYGPGNASMSRSRSAAALPAANAQYNREPVVLEFTIGQDFEPTLRQIAIAFKKDWKDAVKVKTVNDPTIKGCRRLVVLVGSGIVLWDRHTMITHMDDPFESFESSKVWVQKTVHEKLPPLLRAVNLGK